MHVDEVELRTIRLPYKSVFKTSFAAESEKTAVIVTVRSDGVEGYGESVMDHLPSYREESIVGALHLIREALVPWLLENGCDDPLTLCESWKGWRGNPMAKSALELAVWDCHARQLGVPMQSLLGGDHSEVPVGASLGMNPVPDTLASVARHVEQGYKRIKLKIEPGWDVELLSAVRAEFPDIELTVDANSAYTLADLDVLHQIDGFGLHYIEQPLHWDDLTDHAALAPQMRTPLCLDETLTSPARTKAALTSAHVLSSTSRSAVLVVWRQPSRSMTCALRAACRCGAAACWRPASAEPTTSTWRRCPGSSTRVTRRRPAAPTPATSPSRRSRRRTGSCRFPPARVSASPSTGRSSTRSPSRWRSCGGDDRVP